MPAAHREQYLSAIKRFRPFDDTFMRILFKNNKKLLEKVLNIVLNQTDIQIKRYEIQKDLKQVLSKSIVCDVVIEDTKGNIYDIEVERSIQKALPERLRYYASILDIENAKKNMDYKEFKDIYIIFITEQDTFKKGCPVYHINRKVDELDNSLFNDRIHLMYVNGQYRGNDELGLLMHDFGCSDYREMKTIELKEAVKQLKTGNMEVKNMCEIMEEIRESGRLEGKAEGKAEGILEEKEKIAHKLRVEGMSEEKIASFVECSIFQVREWLTKSNDCLV